MKPEVREMVICYFMKVPEVERQVHDKYAKFTKDHVFHEFPFAGVATVLNIPLKYFCQMLQKKAIYPLKNCRTPGFYGSLFLV